MYLRIEDYYRTGQIAQANFFQILEQGIGVSGDEDIIETAELLATEEVKSYLSGRYRTDDVFKPLNVFDASTNYYYGDRINLTADDYANGTSYTVGIRVVYQSKVYECILNTTGNLPTNATYWEYLGLEGLYYVPFPTKWDDRIFYAVSDKVYYNGIVYSRRDVAGYKEGIVPTDTNYFDLITVANYPAVTGVNPSDATKWTYGDNRNMMIVKCTITIVLYHIHRLINPRNIPAVRESDYTNCIAFLKDIARGKANMDLPTYTAQTGYMLRAGSNEAYNNTY